MNLAHLGVELIGALRGGCSDVTELWGLTQGCKATPLARFLWRCLEVYQRPEDLAAVLIGICFTRDWGVGGECARVYSGALSTSEKNALYWYYHNAHPLCIPYAADISRLKDFEFFSIEFF